MSLRGLLNPVRESSLPGEYFGPNGSVWRTDMSEPAQSGLFARPVCRTG